MTQPPARSSSDAERHGTVGPPRWVKAAAVVAVVLIALIVLMLLVGGGSHGPARHG